MEVDEPGPEDKSEVNIREGIPLMTEEGTEASSMCAAHAQILNNISLLKKHFPYSMCGSVLVANISWELLLEWHKSTDHISILNAAVLCLQTVPNIHVRQGTELIRIYTCVLSLLFYVLIHKIHYILKGLSYLMWSSHLRQRFETATQIVRDSHGNPKEQLCQRELQMSEAQLSEFIGICVKFIELFIEVCMLLSWSQYKIFNSSDLSLTIIYLTGIKYE